MKFDIKEYFEAKGRMNRSQFAKYFFAIVFFIMILLFIGILVSSFVIVAIAYILAFIGAPAFAAAPIIKRFHDLDKSGVNFLWLFLPIISLVVLGMLFFNRGTNGSNKYGEDPLIMVKI